MDPTQERIKYYTELIKVLWLTLVADVGGIIGLLVGAAWPWKIWLIAAGSALAMTVFFLIVVLHMVIERLIKTREGNRA